MVEICDLCKFIRTELYESGKNNKEIILKTVFTMFKLSYNEKVYIIRYIKLLCK